MPQSAVSRTETDLIGAVRCGDDRAFGELYSRYGSSVLGYVGGIVRDRGRAEDISQDVFVSALRAMRASDRPISFKSWIYEIARNACIDEFRRAKRCPEVSVAESVVDGRELAATTASPEGYLERRQQLDALRGAFNGLSESQHKVLVLRELEGRSYAEIAGHTGMSVPMVESTLFRARRRLGEEYAEIATGRRCVQVQALIGDGDEAKLTALGLRERRRFARHIAHCQPCRRHAFLAGIDESALQVPSVAKKIAALFPLPFVPWRDLFRGGRLSHFARSLHRASQTADPGVVAGAGQTALAVVAAAIVVSGGLGGVARSNAQPAAYIHSVTPAASQVTRSHTSAATPVTVSHQSRSVASVHRAAHHPGSRTPSSSNPGPRLHVRATSPAVSHQPPAPSAPSTASPPVLPSIPSPLHLPSLPGNPLRTVHKDVQPLVHRVTSPVKRALHKLPPPLKKILGSL